MTDWIEEDILVTVRAYPTPSQKHVETSCVAGLTVSGEARRLFPIPDRYLEQESKFRKFEVVRVRVGHSSDPRPESRKVDIDHGIRVVERYFVGSRADWPRRNIAVEAMRARSMEELSITAGKVSTSRSLALVRPREIVKLEISKLTQTEWSEKQRAKLAQLSMLSLGRTSPLEFIPYKFFYHFLCDDDRCIRPHRLSVVDWEMSESYRKWSKQYGNDWRDKFRQKYEGQLLNADLQFFVGTISDHPMNWLIVGLYYPPKHAKPLQVPNRQTSLFD